VVLTAIGVVIVGSGGSIERLAALAVNFGDVLMVIACLLYAGYTVALRKRPPVSALGLFAVMAFAAFAASLPLVFGEILLGQFQWPTPTGWVIVALVTLFPSLLAQISFIQGVTLIGRIDPRRRSPRRTLRALSRHRAKPGARRNPVVGARQGGLKSTLKAAENPYAWG
jgi:hypothetical protein